MNNIEIVNLTRRRIDKNFIKKIIYRILKFINLKKIDNLNIVFVGDRRIKVLNKKYKGKNRITDVLAFNYSNESFLDKIFTREGEIVICLSQADRQAKKFGHSFKKELVILLIHGLLHLKGYNDETPEEQKKMFKEQVKIFQKIKQGL